jgi:hypothetical protein
MLFRFALVCALATASLFGQAAPASWVQLQPGGFGPGPGSILNAGYSAARKELLVFAAGDTLWKLSNADGLAAPNWTRVTASGTLPGERSSASIVYDEGTDTLTMFGGGTGTAEFTADLYQLTGAFGPTPVWQRLNISGPTPRLGASLVWQPSSGRAILFGGRTQGAGYRYLGDTWALRLTGVGAPEWIPLLEAGPARYGHGAFYDPASDVLTVFSGFANDFLLSDSWVLRNASGSSAVAPVWERQNATFPAVVFPSAVTDVAFKRGIFFGGLASGPISSTLGLVTNSNAAGGTPVVGAVNATNPPAGRWGHSAFYDPNSNRMILFGGRTAAGISLEVWVLRNANGLPNALSADPAILEFRIPAFNTPPAAIPFTVSSRFAPLRVTATAQTASGTNWLVVTPTDLGATPRQFTASIDMAAAPPGILDGSITITAEDDTPPVVIPVQLIFEACTSVAINPAQLEFTAAGGVGTFEVVATGNCGWTVSSGSPWARITANAIGTGRASVTYQVDPNLVATPRQTLLSVRDKIHTVSQAASPCNFTLGSNSQEVSAAQATYSVTITGSAAGCAWDTAVNVSWVRLTSGVTGVTAGVVQFQVDANSAIVARQTTLILGGQPFVLRQSGTPAGLRFQPIAPCRLVDTRVGEGKTGAFGPPALVAGAAREVPVPQGSCGVPATALAYSLNVTVLPAGPVLQFLTVWPSGDVRPNASTLNSFDGKIVANAALIPAGPNGAISVYSTDATELIVDINGYFVP